VLAQVAGCSCARRHARARQPVAHERSLRGSPARNGKVVSNRGSARFRHPAQEGRAVGHREPGLRLLCEGGVRPGAQHIAATRGRRTLATPRGTRHIEPGGRLLVCNLRQSTGRDQATLTVDAVASPTVAAARFLDERENIQDLIPSDLTAIPVVDGDATLCDRWRLLHTFEPFGEPTGNAVVERFIRTLRRSSTFKAVRPMRTMDGVM